MVYHNRQLWRKNMIRCLFLLGLLLISQQSFAIINCFPSSVLSTGGLEYFTSYTEWLYLTAILAIFAFAMFLCKKQKSKIMLFIYFIVTTLICTFLTMMIVEKAYDNKMVKDQAKENQKQEIKDEQKVKDLIFKEKFKKEV